MRASSGLRVVFAAISWGSLVFLGCRANRLQPIEGLGQVDPAAVERIVREAGLQWREDPSLSRSGDGRSLRVSWVEPGFRAVYVIGDLDRPPLVLRAPAAVSYLNDANQFVAWFDDIKSGITLRDGSVLPTCENGAFSVDPSGRYFLLGDSPGATSVGRIDNPTQRITLPSFLGRPIFPSDGAVLVFDMGRSAIRGRMLSLQGTRLLLEREFEIPRSSPAPSPFYVEDVSIAGDSLLLRDVWDAPFSSEFYTCQVGSTHLDHIGSGKSRMFFLTGSLQDRLRRGT